MSAVSTWSEVAANNNAAPPNGFPEGQAPSTLNDCSRELMASIRTFYNQVRDGTILLVGSVAGTDTITGSLPTTPAAYAAGQTFIFEPAVTNTAAVTINLNALGAVAIVKQAGSALVAGDLVAGVPALIVYDGTQFYLINPLTGPTIAETQITDGSLLARNAGNETITGSWSFTARPITTSQGGFLSLVGAGNTGGAVTVSTSDPSGTPAAGDIWLKYTA